MISFSFIYWDPKPEVFNIPLIHLPILWYGLLFALGFVVGFPIFVGILTRFLGEDQKKIALQITDRLTVYMVIATVLGARLGHFLFYEKPSTYLSHPLELLKIWEGGLASHGAMIAILLAVFIFSRRVRKTAPQLGPIPLLDFLSIPTALAGGSIRLGNFINQEILGTPTDLPWGVIFGHPADRSLPEPRHPVQLYESIFYFLVFFLLWRLSFYPSFLRARGKLIGLFLILVFGFRFLIEFLKTEQSQLDPSFLTMGQILSIPAIIGGIYLYFRKR